MTARTYFGRLARGSQRNFADDLRAENTGAILLLLGAIVALVWANSPWREGYAALGGTVVGPAALHLDLTVAEWATDGQLPLELEPDDEEEDREQPVGGPLRDGEVQVERGGADDGPAALHLDLTVAEG